MRREARLLKDHINLRLALKKLEAKYMKERRRFSGLERFATSPMSRERAFGETNVCSMIISDLRKVLEES